MPGRWNMTEEEYLCFIQPYEDALKNIRVRVEVLNDDYRRKYQNYPIHYVQHRIKQKESIENKLEKNGYDASTDSARNYLTDIAGIRVICYFVRDIYAVVGLLKKQSDIVIIKESDYIAGPKPNGYRSFHMVFGGSGLSHRRHGILSRGNTASHHVHGLMGQHGAPHLL